MCASEFAHWSSQTDKAIDVYAKSLRSQFAFLKDAADLETALAKSLPLRQSGGMLVPVGTLWCDDHELSVLISEWNLLGGSPLPAEDAVTVESANKWLQHQISSDDCVGFLALDKRFNRRGIVAISSGINSIRSMELTCVAGTSDANCLLAESVQTLNESMYDTLWPAEVTLTASQAESATTGFFSQLGFVADLASGSSTKMTHQRQNVKIGEDTILTAGPSISARETYYASQAAKYGWNRRWNEYLSSFEKSFAQYIGVKHAIATSCCTGGMQLALLAVGIGPGDEVIVPDMTWVATAAAVAYTGAEPIFADVEEDSWCLDAASVRKLISPRTKAIIPVHLYGHPTRMDGITRLAEEFGLRVIEDAAPSIGAEFGGRRTGSFGDFACFSFQGAKLLVTGEGGMILTDDDSLYERVHKLWDQGRVPGTFWIDELGWKYKMSNLQAAVGLGQLERIDELVEAKRRVFSWYEEELGDLDQFALNHEVSGARSIYWMTSLLLYDHAPVSRDELIAGLKQRNVDTRPVFPAISQYEFWPRRQSPQPTAKRIGERALNLPSGVCLTREQIQYVCRCIREILNR